jgi:DnaJ-class molecular chaperone
LVYIIDMDNAWTYGAREVLAELEIEAREGFETDTEGACPECHGSGIEGILPDDREVPCAYCGGSGKEG